MWSGFEGDKDVFEEVCNLFERVICVVTSFLSRRRRTENLGKWAVHMILGGIVPESCDLCWTLHITSLVFSVSLWNHLWYSVPRHSRNFLMPQSTECSPHINVVFQQESSPPHFHLNVGYFWMSNSQVGGEGILHRFHGLLTHWSLCQWTVPLGSNRPPKIYPERTECIPNTSLAS
jgi:hypothetical protein